MTLLCGKLDEFVYFLDDPEEIQQLKEGFHDLAQFPGAVGAIDGMHVRIQSPGGDDAVSFINRKAMQVSMFKRLWTRKAVF